MQADHVPSPQALPKFDHIILVLGDLILDEYLIGRATRLSREAAVPVLERTRRHLVPGGAANPAVGIVALGGRVTLAGVIGEDEEAENLCQVLEEREVGTSSLVVDPLRPTTTKTRIVAEGGFVYGQHLARIDYLERRPLDKELEERIVENLYTFTPTHDVLLVSDYKNGVVTPSLIDHLRSLSDATGVPLVVDSQGDLERFHGFSLVKCNRSEAESFLNRRIPPGDTGEKRRVLKDLYERVSAGAVVVTLGSEGIAWYDERGYGETSAARAEVYDVTGAGDTVMAVLALGQAAKLPLSQSCYLATRAATLTVRHMGNYAPTRQDLARLLEEQTSSR